MGRDRPREITDEHLAGIFAVYVRQSKDEQVEQNDGGTADQLSLVQFAEDLGWPRERIRIYDRDQALSALATAHRPDILKIVDGIEKSLIKAIGVRDFMRPARDAADEIALWKKCRIFSVVVVVGRQVYDPRRDDHFFFLELNACLGEQDGFKRTAFLDGGRRAKANEGKHVSGPPSGIVRLDKAGNWDLHPDPLVRRSLRSVIDTFLVEGTLAKARDALRAAGIMIPRTRAERPIEWVEPNIWNIERILKNPAYAGRYHYRKMVSDPKLGLDKKGHSKVRPAKPGETIKNEKAHVGCMSPEEQAHILERLASNRAGRRHSLSRDASPCWLRRLLYCARHPRKIMSPKAKPPRRDGGRSYEYQCEGLFLEEGRDYCGTLPAMLIQLAVKKAMFEHVRPEFLRAIQEECERVKRDAQSEARRRQLEIDRANEEAQQFDHLYLAADQEPPEVRRELGVKWAAALRRVDELKRLPIASSSEPSVFDDPEQRAELTSVCSNLRTLFELMTTTNEDRIQISRVLIEKVISEKDTSESVGLRIKWRDGSPDTIVEMRTFRAAYPIIKEDTSRGMTDQQIADHLNGLDIFTHQHKRWTATTVSRVKYRLSKPPRRRQPRPGNRRRKDIPPAGNSPVVSPE